MNARGWLPAADRWRAPHPPKPSAQARYVVNSKMGSFPAGRKRFYNSRLPFPTRRKWAAKLAGEGAQNRSIRPERQFEVPRGYTSHVTGP